MKTRDKVLQDRYLQEGETENDMYQRVAQHLAATDKEAVEFYDVMSKMLFLPNTPTLINAGSKREGGYSACYVLSINDNIDSIYKTLKDHALIHKAFGGTGLNFSKIRPEGDTIGSTGGRATGPIGFIKLFDANASAIKQGGHREGANMAILNVSHPDIEKFINAEFDHFNSSVGVTDAFMEAVRIGDGWQLTFDDNHYGYIDARELFNKICNAAWKSGNPGIVFLDRIQEFNPTPDEVMDATNPCIVGDTMIQTVEGTIPIRELVGKEIDVYCLDENNYQLVIAKAHDIRISKKQANLVEVVTSRKSVICTPDHKFYTRNRGWVEAQYLINSDKITGLNRFPRNERHVLVMLSGSDRSTAHPEHRFIAEHYWDITDKIVHHKNNIPTDNRLSNLEPMNRGEHSVLSNVGHDSYCPKDPDTGIFIPKWDGYVKPKSNALGENKVGNTLRLLEVKYLDYTEDVYDLTVDTYHNCIANGIVIHNCGEQMLLPYESCNLGSINLAKVTTITQRGEPEVDWMVLGDTIRTAVSMLDAVIDKNEYPLEEVREKTLATRKIGLGVMGWHDMLIRMGIAYDSSKALELADKVMEFITNRGVAHSIDRGVDIGVFPNWENSIWNDKQVRMRNATVTTIAPTGTLSIIAECSSGIEPVYDWEYVRKVESGTFVERHPTADLAEAHGLTDTAKDISWKAHIRMQAAFQKHVHNAVSKTINMKNDVTVDDVKWAYEMAYETGCKGVTIYRDGSRDEQVLSSIDDMKHNPPLLSTDGSVTSGQMIFNDTNQPLGFVVPEQKVDNERPKTVSGKTTKCTSGCGSLFVTTNVVDGKPYELFVHHSDGGCQSNMEAIGRLISLALKEGIEVDEIVGQLSKIKCSNAIRSSKSEGDSCSQIIGKQLISSMEDKDLNVVLEPGMKIQSYNLSKDAQDVIREYEGVLVNRDSTYITSTNKCPECGDKLDFGEGCNQGMCRNCGWSGCN